MKVNMSIKELEKGIKKIKKMKGIGKETTVYIDCYECLVFGNTIVIDINEGEIFEREV